jgi:hypothetical protein
MKIRHALADRGDDFYPSPPEATWGLLAAEHRHMPLRLWEPACGDGAIVRPLRAAGYKVFASDLVDRGCPGALAGVDFLMELHAPAGLAGIVTNPPYKLAQEFIDVALDFSGYVAVLLRLQFLESEKRRPLFERWPLAAVHVFSSRLPMMHRDGWDGPRTGSQQAFAWFVFDQRRANANRLSWISADMIAEGRRMCGVDA